MARSDRTTWVGGNLAVENGSKLDKGRDVIGAAVRSIEDRKIALAKRRLFVHDSATFSVLLVATATLFTITFFFFRSFESHRQDLGRRWAQRGEQALSAHKPADAVVALRAALAYAPDDVDYQLLLAQALADSGHTDEATTYYMNRWELRPGDGFVNLQLARLSRQKGDAQQAIEYYRASIFGDWGADGADKRRQVRMELSDYLIDRRDLSAARAELLIGASNAPNGVASNLLYGDRLQAAGDLPDAMKYYDKAIADSPHQSEALEKAGRAAYALGQYRTAHGLLDRALKSIRPKESDAGSAANIAEAAHIDSITVLASRADRMHELDLSRELPANVRAAHLLTASAIARRRLNACESRLIATSGSSSTPAPPPAASPRATSPAQTAAAATLQLPADLQSLSARWKTAGTAANQHALANDATMQDATTQLIFDTEQIAAKACGAPAGDDALLLQVASNPLKAGAAGPQ